MHCIHLYNKIWIIHMTCANKTETENLTVAKTTKSLLCFLSLCVIHSAESTSLHSNSAYKFCSNVDEDQVDIKSMYKFYSENICALYEE